MTSAAALSTPSTDYNVPQRPRITSFITVKPGFHYPSSQAELTASEPVNSVAFFDTEVMVRKLGCIFWYPSWRVSKNAPEFTGRQLGPSTRAVNSGSGNRALHVPSFTMSTVKTDLLPIFLFNLASFSDLPHVHSAKFSKGLSWSGQLVYLKRTSMLNVHALKIMKVAVFHAISPLNEKPTGSKHWKSN